MRSVSLHTDWRLFAGSEIPLALPPDGVPATVPGCVHTDLLAAGLVDDPYQDANELATAWIGRSDWRYATTFAWEDDGASDADLVFQGLDTVAEIRLNGTVVGRTSNQHRSYRFGVRELLQTGANSLEVRFTSAYVYAEDLRKRLGDRPGAYDEPYQFIRKTACNFGWDWGPTLVTCGIWRPVRLESYSGPRITGVRLAATVGADGVPRLDARVETTGGATETPRGEVEVAGVRGALDFDGDNPVGTAELTVPGAEAWWPRGHGGQPLYEVTVRVGDDIWRGRTGFRTVELERDAFRLSVNGETVLVRGVNWIPDDCFPARLTRERLAHRLDQAVAAGVNLVRVWGGGLYESHDFYGLCDERGLLVWQDFLFACAAYPEEEPLRSEVEAEARENVVRLSPHPSLVVWCGNNENLEGYEDWGWRDQLDGLTWGEGYYHRLLPSVVADSDPSRPYWPGSPYSGTPELPAQDPDHGTVHVWDVWNRVDYTAYADKRPRFVAEFGFQGPPAWATVRSAVTGELAVESEVLAAHQKAEDGSGKLLRGLGPHLPRPATFDDWHWLTQLNQARAIDFGIRHFRALAPHCTGTVLWQLNDCWPVISWSAVDGHGRRKPLWYALRDAYAERLLTGVHDGCVVLCNDTGEPWEGTLALTRHDFDGAVTGRTELPVSVPAREVLRVPVPAEVASGGEQQLLRAELGDRRHTWFYAPDAWRGLPEPRWEGSVSREDGSTYVVTVTARTLLRDLALFPDRLSPSAEVDRMLVTLLPGETAQFHVSGGVSDDPEALLRRPVLRCANDVVPEPGE